MAQIVRTDQGWKKSGRCEHFFVNGRSLCCFHVEPDEEQEQACFSWTAGFSLVSSTFCYTRWISVSTQPEKCKFCQKRLEERRAFIEAAPKLFSLPELNA